jgi:hypothetical protein
MDIQLLPGGQTLRGPRPCDPVRAFCFFSGLPGTFGRAAPFILHGAAHLESPKSLKNRQIRLENSEIDSRRPLKTGKNPENRLKTVAKRGG